MGPAGVAELNQLISRIINISVGLAFVALLIMFIIGGIRWLISGGEPKAVSGAQQTLTQAIIGIVFLALAWLILQLIESFTGVKVTQFCIGFRPFCPI